MTQRARNPEHRRTVPSEEGTSERPSISVVIPVHNEEENVAQLYHELKSVLDGLQREWEILFVDDGSQDASAEVIRRLCDEDSRVALIRFRRNFGQTAALAAGLREARGDVVITLDGDGQNDPADIPRLLEKLDEGYDLVNGWRKHRRDPFWNRRLPSWLANQLIRLITGVRVHDSGCSLKAIRREIAGEMRLYGDMHRFIPAIAHQLGAKVTEIPVRHRPRLSGRSNYGIGRTFRVILDLITVKFLSEYSTRPGHLFGLLGLLTMSVGVLVVAYLVVLKVFFGAELANRPLLLLAVFTTLVGIQLLTMGLLGEMLSRVYHESQGKPTYIVKEFYRKSPDPAARTVPAREMVETFGSRD
ncbi:MAG TPA: glycosyltransferase family 2 protein [Acidobacteriota bacterium]|nr:glycosyltransferase family 2 protein [Acidobacteriota bacterium]HRR56163.1 glycosyltransferase family 2 protein [Acidobacteriota bacterium]